jgi:hypothetical protein
LLSPIGESREISFRGKVGGAQWFAIAIANFGKKIIKKINDLS